MNTQLSATPIATEMAIAPGRAAWVAPSVARVRTPTAIAYADHPSDNSALLYRLAEELGADGLLRLADRLAASAASNLAAGRPNTATDELRVAGLCRDLSLPRRPASVEMLLAAYDRDRTRRQAA